MKFKKLWTQLVKFIRSKPEEGVSSRPPDTDLDTMREQPTPEEESEHWFTKTFKF
jgi:hypothetical protein